ncbi:hypothetical protein A9Q96_09770 [Rhodobacterales bacterium 52_120_T64]|nr:hypothetical protein A9Q96_09770 [Rhodobacterales bacterium 52_120_T64]
MGKTLWIGVAVIAVAMAASFWWMTTPPDRAVPIVNAASHGAGSAAPAPKADSIIVPELSQIGLSGEIAFNENCSACHGKNAAGTDSGPPLIHKIYEPGHHGDMSFALAANNGVTSHHWRFGNMPPVEGITEAKIRWITKYIREVQSANGIN